MSVQEFKEKPTLKCCKEENCGMDECAEPCEQAQWELDRIKFIKKCKTLNYPGQERFGRSNKLFIHIGNEQEIYVSAQAREFLDWQEINEPKFIAECVAMMQGSLNAYQEMRDGWVMSARRLSVLKGSISHDDEDGGESFIKIEVKEFSGIKNNGKDYSSPWRGPYPIVTPEMILSVADKPKTENP